MNTIGSRILNLRADKDIKQSDLANQIGITKSMLSKYENDINIPKADILSKIADVLDTTTDYLLCRVNNSAPLSKNNQIKFLDDYHFKIYNIADELNLANKIRLLERANTLLDLQKEQNKNQINPLKKDQ